ncbi:transglycosylase SLT domain-containing protein [Streptomyces sp. V4-01]|uniref:Transglycosylase SLT domain-containing protein n=1 Tax=Actinacidiphila polyblastidii TaxID=3110430 RepID=A0ABU7PG33_9ACTN|nr:transglycosylase SLT domain-containing protein [Streptomyces sp. V4-01]
MRFPKKLPTSSQFQRLSKKHKITAAGAVAAAAVVLTVTGLEATAGAGSASAAGDATGNPAPTTHSLKAVDASATVAPKKAVDDAAKHKADAAAAAKKKAARAAAKKHAIAAAAKKAAAHQKAVAHKKAAEHKKAKAAAAARAEAKAAAGRSAHRVQLHLHAAKAPAAAKPAAKTYANDLDGWIRQSLDILHAKGIPASYEGIHRNVLRESSGNPQAINLWDVNAQNGIPSKGLLQVIDPTFKAYHVAGTSWNIYNPVANITAACNYAADKYGTMDNVNSAY